MTSGRATDANWVDFSAIGGGPVIGTYRQVSRTLWKEDSPIHGRDQFEFVETNRGPGSLTLFDASRKVTLKLNFNRNTIFYDDDGKVLRPLYSIASVSTKPTGWLVTTLEYGAGPGAVQGMFFQTDAAQWAEQSPDGKTRFNFAQTGRDDWSVYLYDASRDTHVQLDLFRAKVLVGEGTAKPADFYSMVTSSAGMTGYLVNQVDFTAGSLSIAGSYRMSGPKTWVEDSVGDGVSQFEFQETQRDDWSVYLHDNTRGATLQLDLFTRKIFYSDANNPRYQLYEIAHADVQPRIGIENGRTVTWVETGDESGNVIGAFRQVNADTWAEDSKADGPGITHFREAARGLWSVYLVDPSRPVAVQIDLSKGKAFYNDPKTTNMELCSVLNASSKLNGWLVNTVSLGNAQNILGTLQQTGWTSWIEADKDGASVFDFEETGRDDGSVTLSDVSRAVQLKIDLNVKKVYYTHANDPTTELYSVASFGRNREQWAVRNRITSRSALTEDYVMDPGTQQGRPVPVYRTSVTLPPFTTFADVWAADETDIQINEAPYTIDNVRSVRIQPSLLSRLTISVAANDLQCPKLMLRTNLMKPGETHFILPDVEAHRKIVELKDGALNAARQQLALSSSLSSTDVDDLQKSLQNIAKVNQYSYNYTKDGVLRDRAVLPANMDDPHFMLDFSGGGARYTPLNKDQVLQHTDGARRLQAGAAQNIFDDIGGFFKQASQIIVHTVEQVTNDIVDAVKDVGTDVVTTVDHVGEALVHGDILEAGKDLIEGGENVGEALVKGVADVAGDVVEGVGQLAVVTLKLGSDLVQFVVDHTGYVGKALGWLLEKAGAAIDKAVNWLLDKIDWPDILHTHDVIQDSVNRRLDDFGTFTAQLKSKSDTFFTDLAGRISADIDGAIAMMQTAPVSVPHPPGEELLKVAAAWLSESLERVEWLMGKLVHFASESGSGMGLLTSSGPQSPVAASGPASPLQAFAGFLENEVGADGGKIRDAFSDATAHLQHVFTDGTQTAQDLLIALLDLLKGSVLLALDIVSKVIDAVLDLVTAMIAGFKSLLNETWDVPFVSSFYKGLTSRPMTILSIASLLVAIPTTLISKSFRGTAPFAAQGAALQLPTMDGYKYAAGLTYAGCRLVCAITSAFTDTKKVAEYDSAAAAAVKTRIPKAKFLKIDGAFRGVSATLGLIAQCTGLPIVPGQGFSVLPAAAKDDVFEAPEYWSKVLWAYDWAEWCFGVVTSLGVSLAEKAGEAQHEVDIAGNLVSCVTAAMGIVEMALAGVLDHADRNKADALGVLDAQWFSRPYNAGQKRDAAQALENWAQQNAGHQPRIKVSEMNDKDLETWLDDLNNYHEWATENFLWVKGFANVLDSFPSIGQLGLLTWLIEPTGGATILGTILCDFAGNGGEGGAYAYNTVNGALY